MKTVIRVENVMVCGCRGSIHRGLAGLQGVYGVAVDPVSGCITVDHTGEVDRRMLESRIEQMGYRVVPDPEREES